MQQEWGVKMNPCRILVGKPEGKRPLGGPRRRRVGNIKIDLKRDRMGWYGLDWIDLAQDRDQRRALVNTVMNFLELLHSWQLLKKGYMTVFFSGFAQVPIFHWAEEVLVHESDLYHSSFTPLMSRLWRPLLMYNLWQMPTLFQGFREGVTRGMQGRFPITPRFLQPHYRKYMHL
jgi:hypothetical protein